MTNRLRLERLQVWIYLAAIALGMAIGTGLPGIAASLEYAIWPALGLLLYATFAQMPLLHLQDAFRDHRFMLAVVLGNFLLIPVAVWLMLPLLPADPALRLGVLLVLLVPCTDWFITFSQLGGGNTARAVAVTPLNLLLQLLLLPFYLWLMQGTELAPAFTSGHLLAAGALIVLPLAAAALSEPWLEQPAQGIWRERLAWCPIPLLALVLLLVAGTQATAVMASGPALLALLPLFIGFLLLAAGLAWALARMLRLPPDSGRTLAFSLGTRNSFVVLPLALALPAGWEMAVMVIVLQSLVELFGMVAYLWWIPRIFPLRHF